MAQCPSFAHPHIVLPAWSGCDAPTRPAVAWFCEPTKGQADTVKKWLDAQRDIPEWILISNCDNAISRYDIDNMIDMVELKRAPTGIATGPNGVVAVTYPDKVNRWSYCHLNDRDHIMEITEKTDPTDLAVCGVYLLRGMALASLLRPTDVYLSECISRIREVTTYRVNEYHGWNDIAQIEEWEARHGNHRS